VAGSSLIIAAPECTPVAFIWVLRGKTDVARLADNPMAPSPHNIYGAAQEVRSVAVIPPAPKARDLTRAPVLTTLRASRKS
jgi:hypothetical protein